MALFSPRAQSTCGRGRCLCAILTVLGWRQTCPGRSPLQFLSDFGEVSSEGFAFPRLNHLGKVGAGAPGRPGCAPAVAASGRIFPHKTLPQPPGSRPAARPLPQISQPPDFDSEVLFTKHSPYPCPRVLPPGHLQRPRCLPRPCVQPLLLQSPLWAHRPGLWVEPSCESPQMAVCISSAVRSLPF